MLVSLVFVKLLLCAGCAGQLKLGRAGNFCLSQSGVAAGVEDAAAHGAITSSSSADAAAHGAHEQAGGSPPVAQTDHDSHDAR